MVYRNKKEQRLIIKEKLQALDSGYISSSDRAIAERLSSLDAFIKAGTLFIYVSTGREVDTRAIINEALLSGKTIAVPKCTGKGTMDAFAIRSADDLVKGAYGIYEPLASCPLVQPSDIDLAVVPCVSCDRECNRLGHGIGFYDRYLERSGAVTAALCREKTMMDHIITEPHDITMDMVITEKKIYSI